MSLTSLSAAKLAEINVKAESIWNDNQNTANQTAEVGSALAVIENQTARIKELSDSQKNYEVNVTWLDNSANEAVDLGTNAGNNCDLEEAEGTAKSKKYFIDSFYKSGFSLNEDQIKYSTYTKEELIARNMMDSLNALDEIVSVGVAAKADAYKGRNLYPLQYTYNNATSQTDVPRARYIEPAFFAYLQQIASMNRMKNSYLIDSGSLFQQQIIAEANGANGEGKGAARLYQTFKIYQDMLGIVQAGLTTDMLMIAKGALAFGSRAKYSTVPMEYGGKVNQTRFSVKSPKLPGVFYDAYYTLDCKPPEDPDAENERAPDGEETIQHYWRFIARTGTWLNPQGSTVGNTGVLGFNITA